MISSNLQRTLGHSFGIKNKILHSVLTFGIFTEAQLTQMWSEYGRVGEKTIIKSHALFALKAYWLLHNRSLSIWMGPTTWPVHQTCHWLTLGKAQLNSFSIYQFRMRFFLFKDSFLFLFIFKGTKGYDALTLANTNCHQLL